jgi:hypothetical protein
VDRGAVAHILHPQRGHHRLYPRGTARRRTPRQPVSRSYLNWNLQRHGVSIERIRRDRVLHEALSARADPLHLAMVFGISQTTASKYTLIACDLLADQPDHNLGERE